MSIELKHLRYTQAAERHGSFRKAAESLSVKQSNLSRRVRALEDQLGVRLFERANGGVRPTLAGRDFVLGVSRILEDLQVVISSARAVGRGEAGRIAVGFYTSLSTGNLRATLIEYYRRFPQIEISATEGSRSRLLAGIANGTIEIAILTGEPGPENCRSMVLWSERVIVALSETHPLATKDVLYWTDLKRERFVLSERDPGPELYDILATKLAQPGHLPNVLRQDVSQETIKSMVGAGCGLSLVSEARVGASYPGVVFREARDGNATTRIAYCACWRDGNNSPALRNFIHLLEERCPPVSNGNGSYGAVSRNLDPSP